MMRGMGWKEGDPVGKRRSQQQGATTTNAKPRVVERRPALLGIGAKEVPNGIGDTEFGAWGKGAKGKGKRKTDLAYNTVILKNSRTGEMLTEEELEAKKLEVNGDKQEDWRERRDRNLAIDGRKKEERRERLMIEERNQTNGHGSSRHSSSSRRERSRSKERRRRDRSRSKERSSHGSSRRRSSSRDRSHQHGSSRRERSPRHSSSRWDRSRSEERRYRRYC